MPFPLFRRMCKLPYHNATAWYSNFSGSVGHCYFYQGRDTLLIVGTSASVGLRRPMYGDGGERPASPWRFADRHGLPPPQSPAERPPQPLKLCLKLHRLARDSDTLRNSVDQVVESRQIALPRGPSLWPGYTALPTQNGVRYPQVRAQ